MRPKKKTIRPFSRDKPAAGEEPVPVTAHGSEDRHGGGKRVATPPAPGHGSENNGMDLSEAKWCDAVLPCRVFWPSREIS